MLNRSQEERRDLYIFGTGALSGMVWEYLDRDKFNIRGYFDNNFRDRSAKNNLPVTQPVYVEHAVVIIASQWQREIFFQCLELGYDAHDIILVGAEKRLDNERQAIREFGLYRYAPYSPEIFRSVLTLAAVNENVSIKLLSREASDPGRLTVYLRHDIDTENDVKNLDLLISIQRSMDIRSAIYVRMDRQEYDPAQLRDYLRELRDIGFEVGLHTSCYLDDDYMDVFKAETNTFHRLLGFAPTSFTLHGVGQVRWAVRMAFLESVKPGMKSLGYSFCDTFDIKYNRVIQDCHGGTETERRFIMGDFRELPEPVYGNEKYLILTHPGYWNG